MPRTTIDIDAAVLRALKARQRREGKTLGALVSELLARSLRSEEAQDPPSLSWSTKPMTARVDLEDKEALHRVLEER